MDSFKIAFSNTLGEAVGSLAGWALIVLILIPLFLVIYFALKKLRFISSSAGATRPGGVSVELGFTTQSVGSQVSPVPEVNPAAPNGGLSNSEKTRLEATEENRNAPGRIWPGLGSFLGPAVNVQIKTCEPKVFSLGPEAIQRVENLTRGGRDLDAACRQAVPEYSAMGTIEQRLFRSALESALKAKTSADS